ncbi:MAG: pentapeptide repeat-containing protein [Thaumarchaeota archaeon]|nr:pentapeptide repeat-containing protein [Nitrososphaerota archaeon]
MLVPKNIKHVGVSLTDTNLKNADLDNIVVINANLSDTDLQNTGRRVAKLEKACGLHSR